MVTRTWFLPDKFSQWQVSRRGGEGSAWLASVGSVLDDACRRWSLEPDEGASPAYGDSALVYPVRRGSERLALKVTTHLKDARNEASLLRLWDGRGMVRLVDADPARGLFLMERLATDHTLHDVPLHDAMPITGRLLRRLVIPAPQDLVATGTSEIAMGIRGTLCRCNQEAGSPLSDSVISEIERIAESLIQPARNLMTHADLHHRNILPGDREPWLAIDPRARVGDPEISVAEVLWGRVDEVSDASGIRWMLDTMVAAAGIDPGLACRWAIVRSADYLLWGLRHGLTDDPPRCRRIIDALLDQTTFST